ncbi:MAG: helix-turn-helix domain-containing protein [Lentisphaerae bacterium]|nr:helix-turn-helix domain-containing protein [Lentisphaerota bacterium]MCP4100830.1 helix-turn-helix domain-containing protein [Lentisphaerota bacterium]
MDLLDLSQNIRKIRQEQGLTVEQLAIQSGFSKGFISRLENFRVNPSLNALQKISVALGVKVGDLFHTDLKSPLYTFGTLNEGNELSRDDNEKFGLRYMALAHPQIGRKINPMVIEYTEACSERDFMMHESDEFFVLLEGEVDFFITDESCSQHMTANDTVYLAANIPHKVRLHEGCDHAKALAIYENTSVQPG